MKRTMILLALSGLLIVASAQTPLPLSTAPESVIEPSPGASAIPTTTDAPSTTATTSGGVVSPSPSPSKFSSLPEQSATKAGVRKRRFRGTNGLIAVVVIAVVGVVIGIIIMRRRRARQRNAMPVSMGADQPADYPF